MDKICSEGVWVRIRVRIRVRVRVKMSERMQVRVSVRVMARMRRCGWAIVRRWWGEAFSLKASASPASWKKSGSEGVRVRIRVRARAKMSERMKVRVSARVIARMRRCGWAIVRRC